MYLHGRAFINDINYVFRKKKKKMKLNRYFQNAKSQYFYLYYKKSNVRQ